MSETQCTHDRRDDNGMCLRCDYLHLCKHRNEEGACDECATDAERNRKAADYDRLAARNAQFTAAFGRLMTVIVKEHAAVVTLGEPAWARDRDDEVVLRAPVLMHLDRIQRAARDEMAALMDSARAPRRTT